MAASRAEAIVVPTGELALAAEWKALLGRLINDGARLRFFPHRILMFLLLAHLAAVEERDRHVGQAAATLAHWKRITRGLTTAPHELDIAPDLRPMLNRLMAANRAVFDRCVARFGDDADRLLIDFAARAERREDLAAAAAFVANDLLTCMNQLVADFAAELTDTANLERTASEGTQQDIAAMEASNTSIRRLTDELVRVNASVRMISLNAMIEAVRAGDGGAAFRTVAAEVKELSGRIAGLTADIRQHLDARLS